MKMKPAMCILGTKRDLKKSQLRINPILTALYYSKTEEEYGHTSNTQENNFMLINKHLNLKIKDFFFGDFD